MAFISPQPLAATSRLACYRSSQPTAARATWLPRPTGPPGAAPPASLAAPVALPVLRALNGSMPPVTNAPPSSNTQRTLAIVPAYNEDATLSAVLAELAEAVPGLDVVVVSDGSRDRTVEVARAAGVAVVELPYNLGIGGALQTGFRFARRQDYDRAVQFDADGQHDPNQIRHLLDALDGGADLVIGSRFASHDGKYRVGRTRRGAMGMIRVGVRLLSGRNFSDTSSGFRGFSRPLISFFADTYPVDYLDSVEALLLALRAGFDVVEIPVSMRERQAGKASNRRLRLAYHFVRLAVVMALSPTRHRAVPREASS
jgi:glycosyltransferase involved in cell wall biosynthesis